MKASFFKRLAAYFIDIMFITIIASIVSSGISTSKYEEILEKEYEVIEKYMAQEITIDESKHLLVVAGAGSGKTLTIIGKINYSNKYKNILPEEILCISFTRDASENLEKNIKMF